MAERFIHVFEKDGRLGRMLFLVGEDAFSSVRVIVLVSECRPQP